jgi:hypothetical protein
MLLYGHPLWLDIANPIRTLSDALRPRPMRPFNHVIAKNIHSKTTKKNCKRNERGVRDQFAEGLFI